MWIIVGGRTIGRLVVCDNPTFNELFKIEKNQIFI
jgi:hypothetical protein